MHTPVIVGFARTAVGDMLGALSSRGAVQLGTAAAGAALERAGVAPQSVDEVVCGMVYKAGTKGNAARQIQLALGCPTTGTASTIDQQCSSGMRALEMACQSIMLGSAEVCVAVGTESMSNVPHLLRGARTGFRMGDGNLDDGLLYDALVDATLGYHMGITAENLAEKYQITRAEQDELALLSHQRASAAIAAGLFTEEIVPVEVKTRKGVISVATDEHPKSELQLADLAKLRPAFKPADGTVTAGNASGVNDGAAALVVTSQEKADELGLKPICRILSTASAGVAPEIMGIGPIYAIPKALNRAGITAEQVDYYEINEAFAAQFLAVNRELKIPMDKVNANGSGIAIGHPVGCTGARIVIATIGELRRRGQKIGVASLCAGGGPAIATVLEVLN
ncbi:MAG: thiolase family protein [Propionibacteriaceae bacterium]|nr:thiolase family protein [Propionibacteriaceae bacterium]